jgi:hypothetical protein
MIIGDHYRFHISSKGYSISISPLRTMRMCSSAGNMGLTVTSSLNALKNYDTECTLFPTVCFNKVIEGMTQLGPIISTITDLKRERIARREGKTTQIVELERAQALGGKALKQERENLKAAATIVRQSSREVVLGIKADTGSRAIQTLRSWVAGLQLPRGTLRTIDENDEPVDANELENAAVYIKYNSSDTGDAYMKPYKGGNVGVIFQVKIEGEDDSFYQFGDLPLALFPTSS